MTCQECENWDSANNRCGLYYVPGKIERFLIWIRKRIAKDKPFGSKQGEQR